MKPDSRTGGPWFYALGLAPVIWLVLLVASSVSGDLTEVMNDLPAAVKNPFRLI